MKKLISCAAAAAAVLIFAGAPGASASTFYPSGGVGVDISYPSCRTKIKPGIPFGVVGVSGGRVYEDNPCAAAEAANFQNLSLYVNTGLYTGGNYFAQAMTAGGCGDSLSCGAYTYGWLAAKQAFRYASGQGLTTKLWWLDVETTNTWDTNTALNVQAIQGEHDALLDSDSTATVGVYAVPGQWNQIVGTSWTKDATWPAWYATGLRNASAATASRYCTATSFTGGPILLVQWVEKLDQDYACP